MAKRAAAAKAPRKREELAYEAASKGRVAKRWLPTGSSADAEVSLGSQLTAWRARDLVRNDGRAAQGVRQLALHIVGTGLRPRPVDTTDAAMTAALRLWEEWSKVAVAGSGLSIYGLQLQAVASMLESGEAVIRRRARRLGDGLPVPVAVQPMEADHIDSSKNEILYATNGEGVRFEAGEIVQGIEFDAIERLAAYWLFRRHPGDSLAPGGGYSANSVRIPAADVIHLYPEPLCRLGQTRGVSWLAPIMIRLRQLSDYELAEQMRKKVAATQALVVTGREPSADAATDDASTLSGEVLTDSEGLRVETIRPGMIAYADEGSTVTALVPPADQSYPAHLETELRQVAAGIGIPYELLTGDLSKVNYSSIQYGMLSFRRLCCVLRDLVIVPLLCQRLWGWFIDAAVAAGELPDREYAVRWVAPAWEAIDRGKEAEADKSELRAGLSTYHEIYSRRGRDYDVVTAEIEAEQADIAARGIVVDSDPRSDAAPTQNAPDGAVQS